MKIVEFDSELGIMFGSVEKETKNYYFVNIPYFPKDAPLIKVKKDKCRNTSKGCNKYDRF